VAEFTARARRRTSYNRARQNSV